VSEQRWALLARFSFFSKNIQFYSNFHQINTFFVGFTIKRGTATFNPPFTDPHLDSPRTASPKERKTISSQMDNSVASSKKGILIKILCNMFPA
tara:strand:- start:1224 stop:1505 length:282 start_codon:yes stop_codon:yes gene_type:complete